MLKLRRMGDVLTVGSLEWEDVSTLIENATMLRRLTSGGSYPVLEGKIVASVFGRGNRKAHMFNGGAIKLGASVMPVEQDMSDEPLSSVVREVSVYSDVIVIDHRDTNRLFANGDFYHKPIISAGVGNPPQALSEYFGLSREWGGDFSNRRIAFVGDLSGDDVAHSLILLFCKFGIGGEIILCSPVAHMLPPWVYAAIGKRVRVTQIDSLDDCQCADAIYFASLPKAAERSEYEHQLRYAPYMPTADRINSFPPETILMNPHLRVRPDGSIQHLPSQQNGLAVRMALLYQSIDVRTD